MIDGYGAFEMCPIVVTVQIMEFQLNFFGRKKKHFFYYSMYILHKLLLNLKIKKTHWNIQIKTNVYDFSLD